MKYANFCDTGRCNINIGDYLQFLATNHLYFLMGVPDDEVVYLGFKDLANYDGAEVVFPFCYSIIDFVMDGKITISEKIKPVFFAVTLSTVDNFLDLDVFLGDCWNSTYLKHHSPIGCRDEKTYDALIRHGIPAYINGCMTAIFPKYTGVPGKSVLFVDAPKSLLPFIPEHLLGDCEFSTQQYHFQEYEIKEYREVFEFVNSKYSYYSKTARLVITSRLHVALPLAAYGIPVVLAKENIDGRFSFIEKYLKIFNPESYDDINWTPEAPDFEDTKKLLIEHALGRIQNNTDKTDLEKLEQKLTGFFRSRTIACDYKESHTTTHKNGYKFDEYADEYWNHEMPIKYALWGASENNADYWKNHIESKYPNAELAAVFDSFREGELFGFPYQHPDKIINYNNIYAIVCSVGAVEAAIKLFKKLGIGESRYCITSDSFISDFDIHEKRAMLK